MGYAKTLIVCFVALAIIACIGSSAASATVLCGEKPEEVERTLVCPAGKEYKSEIVKGSLLADSPHKGETGTGVLKTSIGNIECSKGTYESSLNSAGLGKTTTLVLGTNKGKENCSTTVSGCTKVNEIAPKTPIESVALYESAGNTQASPTESNGSFKLKSPTTSVSLTCGGKAVTCVYAGNENVTGQIYNPGNTAAPTSQSGGKAVLDLNTTVSRTEGGASCPASGVLGITLSLEGKAGAAVYLADNTNLCKVVANKEGKCPAGEDFSGVLKGALSTGRKVHFVSIQGAEGTITCTKTPLLASFSSNGVGEKASFEFYGEGAGEKCKSTLGESPDVEVTLPALTEVKISYAQEAQPKGVVRFPLLKKWVFKWGANTCEYLITNLASAVTSEEEKLTVLLFAELERMAGGEACPKRMWTSEFELTVEPKLGGPVWLTKLQ